MKGLKMRFFALKWSKTAKKRQKMAKNLDFWPKICIILLFGPVAADFDRG